MKLRKENDGLPKGETPLGVIEALEKVFRCNGKMRRWRSTAYERVFSKVKECQCITTEVELEKELGIPTVADRDTIDEGKSGHETEGRGSENDDEESSSEQDGQDLDMSSLNDRIQQTNEIRQNAREGQKRQADQFLQNTLR
ncbi:unnamed protein product [Didymodactylos carnosus]|uniref:Uncharacterized protein n=1 Tax=Didymodactylos carnosus TaxID=1234261 RepID=A0A8S2PAL2_9BILA|nr:unnamed protein product [Didymodactylos carnosus]CAF4039715.1 unnamed protein product [Didymodactylos carnosus]